MNKMGNQQVTEAELGWLAGAMDGEGHIGMHMYNTKRGRISYRIEVAFTNCSDKFLCKVKDISKRLGVNLHIQVKKVKKHWSPSWTLRTGKIAHCKRLLEQILPFLSCKKERAIILLDFCKRRIKLAKENCDGNMRSLARSFPYTNKDKEYFIKFKEFHRNPNSLADVTPTTIPNGSRTQESPKRRAQWLNCDDIV